MSGFLSRMAHAREGSSAREDDKARLRRLREFLVAHGKLPQPTPKSEKATCDVLAEISANELPITEAGVRYASPSVQKIAVAAPDLQRGAPELPSQSKVMAEIYQEHLGKRNWFGAITKTLEPNAMLDAGMLAPLRPLRPRDVARQQAQAQATGGAAAALVMGSVLCVAGALAAGALAWKWMGKPDADAMRRQVAARTQQRAEAIDASLVGSSVRAIGQRAQVAIPEHEGLRNWEAGLKRQFNPQATPRS